MPEVVVVDVENPEHADMARMWTLQDRPRDFQYGGKHWTIFTEGMSFKFVQVPDPGSSAYGSLSTRGLGR
jgi:hypothetical protein